MCRSARPDLLSTLALQGAIQIAPMLLLQVISLHLHALHPYLSTADKDEQAEPDRRMRPMILAHRPPDKFHNYKNRPIAVQFQPAHHCYHNSTPAPSATTSASRSLLALHHPFRRHATSPDSPATDPDHPGRLTYHTKHQSLCLYRSMQSFHRVSDRGIRGICGCAVQPHRRAPVLFRAEGSI